MSIKKILACLMFVFCILSMCNSVYAKQEYAFHVNIKITNDFGAETTEFNVGDTINIDVILKETSGSEYLMYAAQFEVLFDNSCAELTDVIPKASDFLTGTRSNKGILAYLSSDNTGITRTAELLVGRVQLKATKDAMLHISCENAKVTNQDTSLRALEVDTAKVVKIGFGIPLVDRETLKAKIDIANDTKDSVSVSSNGDNISKYAKWVKQSELDAFENVLSSAVRVYNKADATQAELESSENALITAISVFKDALKTGRKPISDASGSSMVSTGDSSSSKVSTDDSSSVINHTISFETNGGNSISSVVVKNNGTVSQISKPIKNGFVFDGWYTDVSLANRFDITKPITQDITLYAKWTAEPEGDTGEVKQDARITPFFDVKANDWYYDSVSYAFKNGLMKGVTDAEFAPAADITRAMFVTVLYRMENEPQAGTTAFSDVESGSYYQNAVSWCATNRIVNGVSETLFAPNQNITREQMAAIAYRYVKYKGFDMSANAEINYKDAASISDYAKEAVKWAKSKGIMLGNEDNTFAPKGNSTRAEAAAVFQRIIGSIK